MSEAHTPGPWTDESIDGSQWGIYEQRGWSVAQAHQIKVLSVDLKQVERSANARLIAAAPCLLDALKYARRNVKAAECDIAFIDAAIARAEGDAA